MLFIAGLIQDKGRMVQININKNLKAVKVT